MQDKENISNEENSVQNQYPIFHDVSLFESGQLVGIAEKLRDWIKVSEDKKKPGWVEVEVLLNQYLVQLEQCIGDDYAYGGDMKELYIEKLSTQNRLITLCCQNKINLPSFMLVCFWHIEAICAFDCLNKESYLQALISFRKIDFFVSLVEKLCPYEQLDQKTRLHFFLYYLYLFKELVYRASDQSFSYRLQLFPQLCRYASTIFLEKCHDIFILSYLQICRQFIAESNNFVSIKLFKYWFNSLKTIFQLSNGHLLDKEDLKMASRILRDYYYALGTLATDTESSESQMVVQELLQEATQMEEVLLKVIKECDDPSIGQAFWVAFSAHEAFYHRLFNHPLAMKQFEKIVADLKVALDIIKISSRLDEIFALQVSSLLRCVIAKKYLLKTYSEKDLEEIKVLHRQLDAKKEPECSPELTCSLQLISCFFEYFGCLLRSESAPENYKKLSRFTAAIGTIVRTANGFVCSIDEICLFLDIYLYFINLKIIAADKTIIKQLFFEVQYFVKQLENKAEFSAKTPLDLLNLLQRVFHSLVKFAGSQDDEAALLTHAEELLNFSGYLAQAKENQESQSSADKAREWENYVVIGFNHAHLFKDKEPVKAIKFYQAAIVGCQQFKQYSRSENMDYSQWLSIIAHMEIALQEDTQSARERHVLFIMGSTDEMIQYLQKKKGVPFKINTLYSTLAADAKFYEEIEALYTLFCACLDKKYNFSKDIILWAAVCALQLSKISATERFFPKTKLVVSPDYSQDIELFNFIITSSLDSKRIERAFECTCQAILLLNSLLSEQIIDEDCLIGFLTLLKEAFQRRVFRQHWDRVYIKADFLQDTINYIDALLKNGLSASTFGSLREKILILEDILSKNTADILSVNPFTIPSVAHPEVPAPLSSNEAGATKKKRKRKKKAAPKNPHESESIKKLSIHATSPVVDNENISGEKSEQGLDKMEVPIAIEVLTQKSGEDSPLQDSSKESILPEQSDQVIEIKSEMHEIVVVESEENSCLEDTPTVEPVDGSYEEKNAEVEVLVKEALSAPILDAKLGDQKLEGPSSEITQKLDAESFENEAFHKKEGEEIPLENNQEEDLPMATPCQMDLNIVEEPRTEKEAQFQLNSTNQKLFDVSQYFSTHAAAVLFTYAYLQLEADGTSHAEAIVAAFETLTRCVKTIFLNLLKIEKNDETEVDDALVQAYLHASQFGMCSLHNKNEPYFCSYQDLADYVESEASQLVTRPQIAPLHLNFSKISEKDTDKIDSVLIEAYLSSFPFEMLSPDGTEVWSYQNLANYARSLQSHVEPLEATEKSAVADLPSPKETQFQLNSTNQALFDAASQYFSLYTGTVLFTYAYLQLKAEGASHTKAIVTAFEALTHSVKTIFLNLLKIEKNDKTEADDALVQAHLHASQFEMRALHNENARYFWNYQEDPADYAKSQLVTCPQIVPLYLGPSKLSEKEKGKIESTLPEASLNSFQLRPPTELPSASEQAQKDKAMSTDKSAGQYLLSQVTCNLNANLMRLLYTNIWNSLWHISSYPIRLQLALSQLKGYIKFTFAQAMQQGIESVPDDYVEEYLNGSTYESMLFSDPELHRACSYKQLLAHIDKAFDQVGLRAGTSGAVSTQSLDNSQSDKAQPFVSSSGTAFYPWQILNHPLFTLKLPVQLEPVLAQNDNVSVSSGLPTARSTS